MPTCPNVPRWVKTISRGRATDAFSSSALPSVRKTNSSSMNPLVRLPPRTTGTPSGTKLLRVIREPKRGPSQYVTPLPRHGRQSILLECDQHRSLGRSRGRELLLLDPAQQAAAHQASPAQDRNPRTSSGTAPAPSPPASSSSAGSTRSCRPAPQAPQRWLFARQGVGGLSSSRRNHGVMSFVLPPDVSGLLSRSRREQRSRKHLAFPPLGIVLYRGKRSPS